ncbi:hypothetical protein O2N63_00460 [Aliiroseovarius sp. KMU-50]|uniref:Uncharacterized protein n=1 Tax=Aliiroseovarius salicola TaxID=3009082 RepID=A0ABT4VWD9_9RHOB|nr:hypothetical protein [Aliiroseovarius sp. KMU-50]MDA5092561.1 hypothetical protein [Aliiroseovarius sp. KMU-50]
MQTATNSRFSDLNGMERVFLIGTVIWTLLQLSRFIAIPLINEIAAGAESEAWCYPAYLDLFAAVFAVPLAWAVIARRGLLVWILAVVYWAISIVDHFGNFVTTTYVGPPSIAEGMSNPYLVPAIMTVLDVIFLILLFVPQFRNMFFRMIGPDNN